MSSLSQPPKHALKFLRWFCREDFIDEIEGNLVELFEKQSLDNPAKARQQFILNTLRHFRPEYLRLFHSTKKSKTLSSIDMIFNYIKLALRNLRKRPSFSFINIFGLALAMSVCLLLNRS